MVNDENKNAVRNFFLCASLGTLAILKNVKTGIMNKIGLLLKSSDK